MIAKPSLLLYCQHSVGLGHLTRSLALAAALRERFAVTFVSGGPVPPGTAMPPDTSLVQLPAVGSDASGRLVSRDGRRSIDRAMSGRRRALFEAWRRIQPDVIVVELFPFGRRKFAAEIEPMLRAARAAAPRPLVYCSLRDILVSRDARQYEYDRWASATLSAYFDGVLVHSDPAFARLEESFTAEIPVPVEYTGFVHDGSRGRRQLRAGSILVSAGGGMVGEPLLRCALDAHALLPGSRPPMTLLAGPFLPEPAWRGLRQAVAGRHDIVLRRSVRDLAAELGAAAASVSQCGYNTALDLLRSGVPALVVPYGEASENEQLRRARRLEALGALRVLPPSDLDPRRLAAEISRLLGFRPARTSLALDGAACSADFLAAAVRERGERPLDYAGVEGVPA